MNTFYKLGALLIVASSLVLAADNQLEDTLNHQYKKHTYTLRRPIVLNDQQYDSLGNSAQGSAVGPWTIYGRIEINKIKVKPNRLIVEGRRVGTRFSSHAKTLVPARLEDKLRLEISLSQPLDSADQARDVFSHVFAFTKDDFLAAVPEIWRTYLADNLESYTDDGRQLVFKPYLARKPADKKPEPPANDVYFVGKDVTAPRGRFMPDPSYSPAARQAKMDAVLVLNIIVDKSGSVRNICLAKPAGFGLDEEAARTVSTWKFDPATRHGEPVAVEVSVEVSFNIW